MERSVRCAATAAASLVAIAFVSTPAFAQGKGGAATATTHVRIVADKFVVVDQHPITVLKGDKTGRIVWELPPKPSPWRFEGDSIAIDGGQFFGCDRIRSGTLFQVGQMGLPFVSVPSAVLLLSGFQFCRKFRIRFCPVSLPLFASSPILALPF